jgi:lysophospholipase L1-like esterase
MIEARPRHPFSFAARRRLLLPLFVGLLLTPACDESDLSRDSAALLDSGPRNDSALDASAEPPLPREGGASTPTPLEDAGLDARAEGEALDGGAADAGDGRDADAGSACAVGDAGARPRPDLCQLEPSQVVVLGDSYFALDPDAQVDNKPFRRNLEALALAAGALEADEHYRDYSASYAFMTPGVFPIVPAVLEQYEQACVADPQMGLLIVNGGGNDVLVGNRTCLEYPSPVEFAADASCVATIDKTVDAAASLLDNAFEQGAQAAVFVSYAHFASGLRSGSYPNTFIDYAAPKLRAVCEAQRRGRCYFVDMRAMFDRDADGRSDPEFIYSDGVHPSAEGSKVIAEAVWKVIEEQCLASQ